MASDPGHRSSRRVSSRVWLAALVAIGIAAAASLVWYFSFRDELADSLPGALAPSASNSTSAKAGQQAAAILTPQERGFVTSGACQKCHEEEYRSWHASFHRTMTQTATPDSIVAPMDDTDLQAYGRTYHFERRGDKFVVRMVDPQWEQRKQQEGANLLRIADAPSTTREIVLATGSHHMQTYWIRAEDGLRQVPWYWHIEEQRWIPSEDSFLRPSHEGRLFMVWNSVCIKCHTVGDIPGLQDRQGYKSQYAELGIACEACHGAGQRHVERQNRLAAGGESAAQDESDETICNPLRKSHKIASEICAQCHSSARPRDMRAWLARGLDYRPGGDFQQHFRLIRLGDSLPEDDYYIQDDYWADGTSRTAGDEYLGLLESACHQRGELSCLSCHSLHRYADRDDQLKPEMNGNAACLQCHDDYADRLQAHTHHSADSSGSQCYNCHMPHITYGLLKGIRSHRIDSPNVAVTARTGRPNACNLCHLDRTLEWTANHLTEWYGQQAADLTPQDRTLAASVRDLLSGDAVQRVVAAWHLGWEPARQASGEDWQAAMLSQAMDDPYSAIRFVGWRSLKKLPGFEGFQYDFVGSRDYRRAAVERGLAMWRDTSPQPKPREAVLLDGEGKLRAEAVEQLLRFRAETRPITIHE